MSEQVQNYNKVSKVLHWSVALLILGLLVVGFWMEGLTPPFKFEVYGIHKALGITVLLLAIVRIVWTHATQKPKALSTHKQWEKILSKTIHIVLYIAMLAFPLSGWVMSSAGGYPISFFGLFEVPPIVGENKELSGLANQIHGLLAYIVIGCVGLHIIGALKHHVMDKDATLTRMGGYLVYGVVGLIALAVAASFPVKQFMSKPSASEVVADVSAHDSADAP